MAEIVLIRHGQTEWSANGRHTSYTDLPLTPEGERQARAAGERIAGRAFTAELAGGDVALIGHGHCLRVTGARWIGLPPAGGGLLKLDTATYSALGFEHDSDPVLATWNAHA